MTKTDSPRGVTPGFELDLTQPILDAEGRKIMLGGVCPTCGEARETRPMQLRHAAATALNTVMQNEDVTGEQKAEWGALAIQLFVSSRMKISVKELALLRERVGKVYTSSVIVARVWQMLEGADKCDS